MFVSVVFTVFIALLSLILWILRPTRVKSLINKLPGPPTRPLVGNALMFKTDGLDFYQQIFDYTTMYEKDRIFRVWVGLNPVIMCFKPETVEPILISTKIISKSSQYRFLEPWLGTGLLTSTGEKWRSHRKLLTPTFHFRILNDFLQVFNEQAATMVQRLKQNAADRESFDIFPYLTLCALDIICDSAMGKHINAQGNSDSEYVQAVYKITGLINKRTRTPWEYPDLLYDGFFAGKEHRRCLEVLHRLSEKVIRERQEEIKVERQRGEKISAEVFLDKLNNGIEEETLAEGRKRKRLAFLDMLLHVSDGGKVLSFEEIREEVDTFMFEGHDTTASASSFAVYCIGTQPEVQRKLQQEVDKIFGTSDRAVTMDDIKEMKYMECVIKEALRLYPSVPWFARKIEEDCMVGGYQIPAGTTATVLTFVLHRDPQQFPDPERFDPDRWLPDACVGRHPFAYVPFSAGLRNCIGQKFAMNEEKVLLSSIVRNFTIESCQSSNELQPMAELILRPRSGIIVKLKSRVQN